MRWRIYTPTPLGPKVSACDDAELAEYMAWRDGAGIVEFTDRAPVIPGEADRVLAWAKEASDMMAAAS